MRADRISFYDRGHRESSFSDTEQGIAKLEEAGKVAGPRYRNECSKVLMGKRVLANSLRLSREF